MPETGHYDASDPTAVDNAGKESARRDKADKETVRVLMNHPNGRDWLWRLLEACHINDDCRGESPQDTYFNLGERNIGNRILREAMNQPDLYLKMVSEQRTEAELRNARLLKQNEARDDA